MKMMSKHLFSEALRMLLEKIVFSKGKTNYFY